MSTVSSDAPEKALTNQQIADIFDTVADMLQLKGEIIHRVMAYRRAAQSIRELPRDIKAIAAEDKLKEIDGIGAVLEEKIREMLDTGHLRFFDELKAEIPVGLVDIMRINGVGPKKVMIFYNDLGIKTIDELKAAAEAGKLAALPGIGAKMEKKVLEGIASLASVTERVRIDIALTAAQGIMATLLALPQAVRGDVGGSIRRGRPTIGDIDLLIAS